MFTSCNNIKEMVIRHYFATGTTLPIHSNYFEEAPLKRRSG